jgi:hypothetical protein
MGSVAPKGGWDSPYPSARSPIPKYTPCEGRTQTSGTIPDGISARTKSRRDQSHMEKIPVGTDPYTYHRYIPNPLVRWVARCCRERWRSSHSIECGGAN